MPEPPGVCGSQANSYNLSLMAYWCWEIYRYHFKALVLNGKILFLKEYSQSGTKGEEMVGPDAILVASPN